jgi:PAS domain S-box-containing protein
MSKRKKAQIERVLQSGHDISERKQAEQALHDSQTRLAAIVESIADGLYAIDRQWRITHINDTALRYFHKSREEVLGCSLFELFPAFAGSVFETELRRAVESGAPIRFHAPSVATGRAVELFGYPSPDTLTVLFRDVTERELQARRVHRLTQLYAVLSQANEMIVRTRDESQIFQEVCRIVTEQMALPLAWIGLAEGRWVKPVAASGPSAAYLGGVRVEVEGELGQGPTGTCIREDRAMVNDDFEGNPLLSPWREAALRHGIRASAAFPLHKNGKPVGALTLYSQQRAAFDSEQVELLLALAADVSYTLDAIKAERLRGEAERALRESERELRDADARKNEFLAMLSHELRNPLAPIRNSLFILQHVRGDGEQVQHAEAVIERQVAHLTSLVDDLLDVTRVTRGKIRLEKEQVNLDELVGRTVEDHRDLFARAGVELAFRPSGARLTVRADRTRLTQVVGNLLQNAVKFTPKGGSTAVSVESREDGQAAVRVCDTGAGIGADILPHLFEPFTQADRTLDRSKGGLGLGLALVRGLVEMHDAAVSEDLQHIRVCNCGTLNIIEVFAAGEIRRMILWCVLMCRNRYWNDAASSARKPADRAHCHHSSITNLGGLAAKKFNDIRRGATAYTNVSKVLAHSCDVLGRGHGVGDLDEVCGAALQPRQTAATLELVAQRHHVDGLLPA